MTNTLPSRKSSARARKSAVGEFHPKRNVLDLGVGLLTPLLGQTSWTATTCANP